MRVAVLAVGVIGPGLPDWASAAEVLRGERALAPAATVIPPAARLPAAERRRVGQSVKLALAVADQMIAGVDPERLDLTSLATVFTSSGGDGENCHLLCEALAADEPQISPTRFTNSVHNAPAGYWSIAAGDTAPSTSLCAYDASFAAGLLEAALQVTCDGAPVALIAYDVPYPEPLNARRPMLAPAAAALLLGPADSEGALARLVIGHARDGAATAMREAALEAQRLGVPAARAWPLLAALASLGGGTAGDRQRARRSIEARCEVALEAVGGQVLPIEVEPCR